MVADGQPGDETRYWLAELADQGQAADPVRWRCAGVPGQVGAVVGHKLGDQAAVFVIFQPIGDIELLHQAQEVGMIAGRVGESVMPVLPDFCQARMVEDAAGLPCWLVFQHIADGFGEPFGIEDNKVPQAFIIAVIDNLT